MRIRTRKGGQMNFTERQGPVGRIALCLVFLARTALSQAHDPGPRSGVSAGGPIPGLTTDQMNLFNEGASRFKEIEQVSPDGLGPRMNLNSCAGCHAFPAVGGTGPKLNPQYQFANSSDHG